MPALYLKCVDFASPRTPGCCSGCHFDREEKGLPMYRNVRPPGLYTSDLEPEFCCKVADWLELERQGTRAVWAAALWEYRKRQPKKLEREIEKKMWDAHGERVDREIIEALKK